MLVVSRMCGALLEDGSVFLCLNNCTYKDKKQLHVCVFVHLMYVPVLLCCCTASQSVGLWRKAVGGKRAA